MKKKPIMQDKSKKEEIHVVSKPLKISEVVLWSNANICTLQNLIQLSMCSCIFVWTLCIWILNRVLISISRATKWCCQFVHVPVEPGLLVAMGDGWRENLTSPDPDNMISPSGDETHHFCQHYFNNMTNIHFHVFYTCMSYYTGCSNHW